MKKTIVIFISGFLGSGKTTLMLNAANQLRSKGMTVTCITNDQGEQLVDSKMVLKKELPLDEIQGGCFCCKFDELVDSIHEIMRGNHPDMILAEAVGSCTDLIATVIKPLHQYHGDHLSIYPLSVVVDPFRLRESLLGNSSFTSEILYLYRKQLEEAQVIVLNKIDLISRLEVKQFETELMDLYNAKLITVSALNDSGIDDWLNNILHFDVTQSNIHQIAETEIDYDIYAQGEAQLGWCNGLFLVTGQIRNVPNFCQSLMNQLLDRFKIEVAEVAHLKLWPEFPENYT